MNVDCILKWLDVVLSPIVLIVLGAFGYRWGHKVWRKQKVEESQYLIEQKKFESRIGAAKAAWSLMVYFSENDSDLNMLRRGELDAEGNKIYYFRHAQAKLFFDELQKVFFIDGHGLFLSSEVKALIFKLRSTMYGLYHHALKSGDTEIKIKKKELLQSVTEIREKLIELLRNQITN